MRSWLCRSNPEGVDSFGVVCSLCQSYCEKFPDARASPLSSGTMTPRGIEDLLRHSGDSRRSSQVSKVHLAALEYHLSCQVNAGGQESSERQVPSAVTAYQVLASFETCFSANAAQIPSCVLWGGAQAAVIGGFSMQLLKFCSSSRGTRCWLRRCCRLAWPRTARG